MIDIITADGTNLDLTSDDSFAIELENPLLEDDLIPTAYSTQIRFLPTPTNLKAFGFLDFMFFEPINKSIGVSISVDGVQLFSGTLVYDSIDEGKICYTFTGKNIEDDWSGKIWERSIVGTIPSNPANVFSQIYKGNYLYVYAPPMINKSETGSADAGGSLSTKFHNEVHDSSDHGENSYDPDYWRARSVFTPIFQMRAILTNEILRIEVDDDVAEYLKYLSIVGLYKPHTDTSVNGWPSSDVNLNTALPDVTAGELIKNILKMFCAAIFIDGGRYRIIPVQKLFSSGEEVDWTDKFSDDWSSEIEGAQKYVFGYSNDDSENVLSSDAVANIPSYETLEATRTALTSNNPNTKHATLQDVYSYSSGGLDMVYHNRAGIQEGSDEGGTFDNSCDFDLVRCLPYRFDGGHNTYRFIEDTGQGFAEVTETEWYYRNSMAAIVEPGTLGERGTKMYVGLVYDRRQLSDKGVIYANTGYRKDSQTVSGDSSFGLSLAPQALGVAFHERFAQWVTKTRQTLSGRLNLSLIDITNFRMWKKVNLRGRLFFVKKLTLTLNVKTGRVDTEGEFISL